MLNRIFLPNSRIFIVISLSLVSVLIVNYFFKSIQTDHANANSTRVESIFRKNSVGSNIYLVLQDINELQASGQISCFKLIQQSSARPIVEPPSDCSKHHGKITDFIPVRKSLVSANGALWTVEFHSNNPTGLTQSYWLVQVTLLVLLLLASLLFRAREKILLLRIEHNNHLIEVAKGVAHDIRSPLMALRLAINSTSAGHQSAEIAEKSLKRIEGIANNLLFKSRSIQSVNLNDLPQALKQVLSELRVINRPAIFEEFVCPAPFPGALPISLDNFQRIAQNLLQNAVDASAATEKGSIKVSLRYENECCLLSVEDFGLGFPQDYQLKKGKSSKTAGNGLGLFLINELITEHGGRLSYRNLDCGAEVKVTLPVIQI